LFGFRHTDNGRARLGQVYTEGRLSPSMSVLVIAGLSALSWAVLIAVFMVVREMLL